MEERYYAKFAVAAVRGRLKRLGKESLLSSTLLEKTLDELSEQEREEIFTVAKANGLDLYHFKRSDRALPRVHKTLGFLKGVYFESLLDVGSGRGVFLLPFLEEFPYLSVTSVDVLEKRVELLSDISEGGVSALKVLKANICEQPLSEKSVDVVTMLEVLEHIPDVESAIRSAVKIAKKYVVVTVPSKEDDNPEHIHLLTKPLLTSYFNACGVDKLSFDGVPGHLFMIAKIED
jgi:SAM-dependent methyltransferase